MFKKLFIFLLFIFLLSGCRVKQGVFVKEELSTALITTCGNDICEVFVDCPEKNCPPSEYPHTCPEDCKLHCAWSTDDNFCTPKYISVKGDYLGIESHLSYILDNYSCQTSLDCPFSHLCTDVKFLDPSITEGRICIFNSLK